jgi:transposase
MDPHKRYATIEVLDEDEQPLVAGRFGTDGEGCRLLLAAGRRFPRRLWAVEGCQGVGRHLAQRARAVVHRRAGLGRRDHTAGIDGCARW